MAIACGVGKPPNTSVRRLQTMRVPEPGKWGWEFSVWSEVAAVSAELRNWSPRRVFRRKMIINYAAYDSIATVRIAEHVLRYLCPSEKSRAAFASLIEVSERGQVLHYDDDDDDGDDSDDDEYLPLFSEEPPTAVTEAEIRVDYRDLPK